METRVSLVACIPVRKEPNERSEMVTQILFGEKYEITEHNGKFHHVELKHDGYRGFISNEANMICQKYNEKSQTTFSLSNLFTVFIENQNGNKIIIPAGSEIESTPDDNLQFTSFEKIYRAENHFNTNSDLNIFDLALLFLETPYLWGGRTFMGIDCSGLVQTAFKMKGISIPRDASEQFKIGKSVEFDEISKGDLAFFHNEEGKISHVGILDGHGNIIHSSGKVKLEKINREGIIQSETGKISHTLNSIKNFH